MRLFILFLVCSSTINKVAQAQPKPNFIVILTDDQRFDAVQQNGNPAILTPNLDRLVQRGKRFTDAHVLFSLCSPSRAAILTGRYGSANGVLELDSKLNLGEKTVANYLKEAGYYTGVSGKWHVDQILTCPFTPVLSVCIGQVACGPVATGVGFRFFSDLSREWHLLRA